MFFSHSRFSFLFFLYSIPYLQICLSSIVSTTVVFLVVYTCEAQCDSVNMCGFYDVERVVKVSKAHNIGKIAHKTSPNHIYSLMLEKKALYPIFFFGISSHRATQRYSCFHPTSIAVLCHKNRVFLLLLSPSSSSDVFFIPKPEHFIDSNL